MDFKDLMDVIDFFSFMQSTIYIFKNLHRNLPPLFPEEIKREMADALAAFEQKPTTLERLEDAMARFGYKIWPWNKAYREFIEGTRKRMGGHFLTTKSDLAINQALVEIRREIRNFTDQELHSTEKNKYLNRVNELAAEAGLIREVLEYLRSVADAEADHPMLADEIRSKVRGFEHSLCELGPELKYHEVENAVEFFEGRRAELDRLRGINKSVEIDFDGEEYAR